MANLSDLVGFALTVTIRYKKETSCLLITYSNSQGKTHKIAQIRHAEPRKRQHTTIEVGLPLF